MISIFILPSNTIFWKTERELSESEIEEEERGREHTPPASQAPAREITPRERSNPEPRALRLRLWIAPFDFAVRLHRSTSPSNRTQIATFGFAGEPRALRLHTPRLRHSTSTSNCTLRLRRRTQSPDHAFNFAKITPRRHRSHWDRNWEMVGFWWIWPDLMNFFWLGFVSVFIYWEMRLYICLEAKKMWGTRRKCVFYIIFSNTTKH